jgi:hypothetical protein
MPPKYRALLLGIIALAIFFRFYQIASYPGGLFPDEAAEGLDAHLIQQGQWQPFYERGNGREALFYYLIAAVITLFGTGSWQLHATASLVGLAAVIACFLMARQLFLLEANNDRAGPGQTRANVLALLATFFMAVSSWHTVLSRTAFRANLIPLFSALTFYFLILTYKATSNRQRWLFACLTGAVFAGGFYSYIAYRLLALVLGILIGWPLLASLADRPRLIAIKKYWKSVVVASVAFAIVIYPLAHYFYVHEGSFVGRSSQVSVFNEELNQGDLKGTVIEVFRLSMQAYFKDGDLNWRHNISGFPFLSPLISPFFAIGLVGVTILAALYLLTPRKRARYWKYALLAGSFWGLLIPVVTTAEGIPHGLRSIGTIPFVFIISAWGLYKTIELVDWFIHTRHLETAGLRRKLIYYALRAAAVCFVLALTLQSYLWYFVFAANSPENYYAFRSDLTTVSNYLNEHGNKNNTYLVLDKFSVQTPEFLTMLDPRRPGNPRNQPYTQVDPEDSWRLPTLRPGDQIVFTQSSLFDTRKFKQYHPETYLAREDRNKFGQTLMAIYLVK